MTARKWRDLTFLMVLQEMIFLTYESEYKGTYSAYTEELLLPVDPERTTLITIEEGSGEFPEKEVYLDTPKRKTEPKMNNYTTITKTEFPDDNNKGYFKVENQKVVIAERIPVSVVVVLIFMTVMLLCCGITIAVLCRKLRSMRKWRSKRSPVQIIHKLEDSDEYSVMMDWT